MGYQPFMPHKMIAPARDAFFHHILDRTMKTKKIIETLAIAALCTGTAFANPIPLQNASITATYNGAAAGMMGLDYVFDNSLPQNVNGVDPFNAEFLTSDFRFAFDFTSDGALTITANEEVLAGTHKMRFDFGDSLANAITGFTLVEIGDIGGVPGLSIIDAHTIELDLSNLTWNGTFAEITTQISAAEVPEPGSTTIVLAGLAGLALVRRARKPRA
jgi:hypothetical protein